MANLSKQQSIYHWKGNLTVSRIRFKYEKNILFRDFMSNIRREMTQQRLYNGCSKKISKLLKYQHIIYHFKAHGMEISKFRIYNYFREIFKFRENMSKNRYFAKFLRVFIKSARTAAKISIITDWHYVSFEMKLILLHV